MKAVWHAWCMRGLLQRFQDGQLSARQSARVQTHLERCTACRHAVRNVADSSRALIAAQPVHQALSGLAAQALLSRALTQAAAHRSRMRRKRVGEMRMAFAVASVAAGCWLFVTHFHAAPIRVEPDHLVIQSLPGSTAPHPQDPVKTLPALRSLAGSPSERNASSLHHAPSLRSGARVRIARQLPHRQFAVGVAHHAGKSARQPHHPMAAPEVRRTPEASAQLVRADDGSKWNDEAEFPALPPGGHLLVTVTEAAQPDSKALTLRNNLSFQIPQDPADTSGSAIVATNQIDAVGTLVWTRCTIQQNDTGEVMTRIATTWETPEKHYAGLIVTSTTPTPPASPFSAPPTPSKADRAQPILPP